MNVHALRESADFLPVVADRVYHRFVDRSQLKALHSDWNDLFDHAVEPNPCYTPEFVSHLMAKPRFGSDSGAATVWASDKNGRSRLIGLLPIGLRLSLPGGIGCLQAALHSPFSGSTVPLVRRGYVDTAVNGLLDCLGETGRGRSVLVFNEFRLDGPVCKSMFELLSRRDQASSIADRFERPLIDMSTAPDVDTYRARASSRTRQSIRRKRRKLEELGDLQYEVCVGQELYDGLNEFLVLENSGWKGRAGTAMAAKPCTSELAFAALRDASAARTRIEMLRLDGRPIAASINYGRGNSGLHFKPAYDEEYSNYSPGLVLHSMTIEGLYRDKWATQLDSAVDPESRLGSIWVDRRSVGRLYVSTSTETSTAFIGMVKSFIETLNRVKQF